MIIPLVATVRIDTHEGKGLRLWVPLFLIWLLLVPFAIVLLPVFVIVCLAVDVDPLRAIGAFWRIMSAIGGTNIEVASPAASVFIHVV